MSNLKLCGIRNIADIDLMNRYQPDYVGFVLAPSTRQVRPEELAKLRLHLSASLRCVGVVVDEPIERLLDIISITGVDVVQLHGHEDEAYIHELRKHTNIELWKAIRIRSEEDLKNLSLPHISKFLLDSFTEGCMGGSGKTFNWKLLRGLDCSKLWIAGGINMDNIKEVLSFHPEGVDISSSLETNGYKDEEKVKQMISEVRGYEQRNVW